MSVGRRQPASCATTQILLKHKYKQHGYFGELFRHCLKSAAKTIANDQEYKWHWCNRSEWNKLWGERLEWNRNCHHPPNPEYFHWQSVHNLLWQFTSARNYLNAEGTLATSDVTPLLVIEWSMNAKRRAGGGAKTGPMENRGGLALFVHTDYVTTG